MDKRKYNKKFLVVNSSIEKSSISEKDNEYTNFDNIDNDNKNFGLESPDKESDDAYYRNENIGIFEGWYIPKSTTIPVENSDLFTFLQDAKYKNEISKSSKINKKNSAKSAISQNEKFSYGITCKNQPTIDTQAKIQQQTSNIIGGHGGIHEEFYRGKLLNRIAEDIPRQNCMENSKNCEYKKKAKMDKLKYKSFRNRYFQHDKLASLDSTKLVNPPVPKSQEFSTTQSQKFNIIHDFLGESYRVKNLDKKNFEIGHPKITTYGNGYMEIPENLSASKINQNHKPIMYFHRFDRNSCKSDINQTHIEKSTNSTQKTISLVNSLENLIIDPNTILPARKAKFKCKLGLFNNKKSDSNLEQSMMESDSMLYKGCLKDYFNFLKNKDNSRVTDGMNQATNPDNSTNNNANMNEPSLSMFQDFVSQGTDSEIMCINKKKIMMVNSETIQKYHESLDQKNQGLMNVFKSGNEIRCHQGHKAWQVNKGCNQCKKANQVNFEYNLFNGDGLEYESDL